MLDDLKMIHERDAQDALGAAGKQAAQLSHSFGAVRVPVPPQPASPVPVTNLVFAGMGGVAASAEFARSWLDLAVPFTIVRDYTVPSFVGAGTLCIVASYSGTTEETLAAMTDAEAKGAQLAVVSHGGALVEDAGQGGWPCLRLPEVLQPRFATWYTLKAIATITDVYGLTAGKAEELAAQQQWFAAQLEAWRPDVATTRNEAKQIALELAGKSVVIYDGPKTRPLAYKWKIALNENSKQVAWCNSYPEANHNEFIGWTRQPVNKPYAIVDIRSGLEDSRTLKRFEVSERLLSGMRPAPVVVRPQGEGVLQQLLYTSALGDFVSIYLALLAGINPAPADITDKLKKELA